MAAPGKLNTLAIHRLTRPGAYTDGGGLYLRIRPGGGREWAFRYKVRGRQHWMGLGPERDITLAEARQKARDGRRLLLEGLDPITVQRARKAGGSGVTFATALDGYLGAHTAGWRNAKHAAQWRATLDAYALPKLGTMPVAKIETADVLAVLAPIWTAKTETASRVRGRIEAVLDHAKAHGWRTGENPARWRGHFDKLLPAKAKLAPVEHHAAVHWRGLPCVLDALSRQGGTSALAVRFAALTAARSGEVRGARWNEMDLDAAVWTVPGPRMKAGKPHRVPLCDAALAILRIMLPLRRRPDDLVFPGGRVGRPLSDVALAKAMRAAAGPGVTVHGLRSTFADWCAEATSYPRELAEAALAHTLRDKVEAAYQRGDLIERRRELMAAWARFCIEPADNGAVVELRRA